MAAGERQGGKGSPPRRDGGRHAGTARRDSSTDRARGVYMISIAAELAGMHPQTLRIYESRGLIRPKRSPKNTRLYSQQDVERLQRIQELTNELGLNLAGVERVMALERELERSHRRVERLERELERTREEAALAVERVRRAERRDLVRYEPRESALVPARRSPLGGDGSGRAGPGAR
jgi:MerR family transcriptional regulator, heat shock protein HspR